MHIQILYTLVVQCYLHIADNSTGTGLAITESTCTCQASWAVAIVFILLTITTVIIMIIVIACFYKQNKKCEMFKAGKLTCSCYVK